MGPTHFVGPAAFPAPVYGFLTPESPNQAKSLQIGLRSGRLAAKYGDGVVPVWSRGFRLDLQGEP